MKPSLNLSPERRLVMTLAMRQALDILQMPQLELGQWLLGEIEKNPLLELDFPYQKKRVEGECPARLTLYDHLMNQIRDSFPDSKAQKTALELFHLLDDKGFLPPDVEGSSVLSTLQTFDPPGIFARSLQESFLLQLKMKGLSHTPTYVLVENHYEDLLRGRFALLKKKLKIADLKESLEILARLTMRPAHFFKEEQAIPITPDFLIERIDGGWALALIEDDLPRFHMQYSDLTSENKEEQESLRFFKVQAKWIFRSLNRRRKLLQQIGRILLCKQAQFFDEKGTLTPLTMKELAEKLELHESTLSRALAGKYAATPKGILPLKSLILSDPETLNAKQMLEKLISSEDKHNPLTDEQIAEALEQKGIRVARRTIAKYRNKLKIGSASQRKHQRAPK